MYKIKSVALIAAILISGILSSATAQKKALPPSPVQPPFPAQVLSGTYKVSVRANQLSAGTTDFAGAVNGWTTYGSTSGDLSGYIFLSVDYGTAETSSTGAEVRQVTGGSWSKLIFIKGVYAGSIHGSIIGGETVKGGEVGEVGEDSPTTISLNLTADGGTEAYAGNVGSGTFDAVVDFARRGPNVTGILTLNY